MAEGDKTVWQEVMADTYEQFGNQQNSVDRGLRDSLPRDEAPDDEILSSLRTTLKLDPTQPEDDARPTKKVQLPDGTELPGPTIKIDPNLTEEEYQQIKETAISDEDYGKYLNNEVAKNYGMEYFAMAPEERRQVLEYETEEMIAAQFGKEPNRSTAGSLAQGFQEGFEKNASGSLATIVEAYTGVGGRLFAENPMTHQREFYQSYDELIPGFDEMSYDDRREAIVKWKEKWYNKNAVERNAEGEGAAFAIGQIGGYIADPTTLIPMGQTYKAAALSGSAIGATDMTLFNLAQNGTIEPTQIIAGGVFGMAGGAALTGLSRAVGSVVSKSKANRWINKYEKDYSTVFAKGESPDFAEISARVLNGNFETSVVDQIYKTAGRSRQFPDTRKAAKQALEARLSFFHRNERLQKIGQSIEHYITPISDVIMRVMPRVGHGLRKMELQAKMDNHRWYKSGEAFFDQLESFSKADKKEIKRLISTTDAKNWGKAYEIVESYMARDPDKYMKMVNNMDTMRETLKEIGHLYKQSGFKIELLPHYFPRVVKNPTAMSKVPHSYVQNALDKEAEALGRPLQGHEVERVMNWLIAHPHTGDGAVKTSGSLRQREIASLFDSMLPHYADPRAAFNSYVRMASLDINRARFLTQFGADASKGYKTSGTDIGKHVGVIIKNEKDRLNLSPAEQDRVFKLLNSRFTTGEQSPNEFIRGFKNLGYTITLGNPLSAITQLGDQAFAVYKSGLRDWFRVWFGKLEKAEEAMPFLHKETALGLDDALEETFSNASALKTGLDRAMKYGGFNKMDKLGKDAIINGSLLKWQRKLKTQAGQREFIAKWSRYFEGDTPKLIADIKNYGKTKAIKVKKGKNAGKTIERKGDLTDNMRLMLFHELSDVQPIALSEMPAAYLNSPNGRVFYMLKTFTVKQVDFMRREVLRKFSEGKFREGGKNLAYFSSLWVMANGSADGLKAAITGQPFDWSDNAVDNMMQLMVWSRYSQAQASKEGLGQAVMDFIAPPVPMLDIPTQAWAREEPERLWELVPVVGKITAKRVKNSKERVEALKKGKLRTYRKPNVDEKSLSKKLLEKIEEY